VTSNVVSDACLYLHMLYLHVCLYLLAFCSFWLLHLHAQELRVDRICWHTCASLRICAGSRQALLTSCAHPDALSL